MDDDELDSEASDQISAGLFKLALVLRHEAWQASGERGLTPTQSQILVLVAAIGPGVPVSAVAQNLSVTKATASEAVSTLERKGMLRKSADPADGRVVLLSLTRSGRSESKRSAQWPEIVVNGVKTLPEAEQGGLLRGLVGLISSLQEQGAIPMSRMCAECRFFRPNQYAGDAKPHHCGYIDAPIGDAELRVDCEEMEPAPADVRPRLMEALFSGAEFDPTTVND